MQIYGFDWDRRNLEHIQIHAVEDYEAEEVIVSKRTIHSKGRDGTYVAYGVTTDGRYLLVVFITKGKGLIRVITARNMSEREKRNYRKRR